MTKEVKETYKCHVPWLETTFLYEKQIDDSLLVYYPDKTPFCNCPILEEHCPDERFISKKGPCPFYTIKCKKHVKEHKIQANSEYLYHYSKNPEKYNPCAFCQFEKTGINDKVVFNFLKQPYIDRPEISFL